MKERFMSADNEMNQANVPRRSSRQAMTWVSALALALMTCLTSPVAGADEAAIASGAPYLNLTPQPVPRLKPGIVVGQHQESGYSDLVTLVLPRLASGHINSLPRFARQYASMFKLAVLANVRPTPKSGYVLEKVGIGFSMNIGGEVIVVTSDTANQFGADLGPIDRGVLSGNEDCLEDIVQVARTEHIVVFDAEANMLIGEKHEKRVIRHLVWASPDSGKIGFLVWLMNDDRSARYVLDSPAMQLLPAGFREDRQIHVSEGGFLSSIPTPDRFALVQLPQGNPIPFSNSFKSVAAAKTFTSAELKQLIDGISQSLASSQANAATRDQ